MRITSQDLSGNQGHAQNVTANDTQGRETSIDRRTKDDSVEGDEIDALESWGSPPPPEDRWSKQNQVKPVHRQRGARVLSNNACRVERAGGRVLR